MFAISNNTAKTFLRNHQSSKIGPLRDKLRVQICLVWIPNCFQNFLKVDSTLVNQENLDENPDICFLLKKNLKIN